MAKNKTIRTFTLTAFLISIISVAQTNKLSFSSSETHKDDIVMTWKKDTPEQEMKDDCKALAEKGINIKYSDVKRNSKEEITGIHLEYSDRKGNKGNLEYDNQNPIGTITFYKNGDEIGFGTPSQNNFGLANSDALFDYSNPKELLKQFQQGNNNSQSFSFSFPKDAEIYGQTKSRIQIQQDGKKPLIIEDGKVIEGGDDYSAEELDKIKSENKVEKYSFSDDEGKSNEFDFRNQKGLDEFKKQMKKIKIQIDDEASEKSKSDFDTAKEDMIKAKEEMIKAREELEKAKKELEKSKGKTKTNKAL